MRPIRVFNRITPEGFFADANGSLDWAIPEPAIEQKSSTNMDPAGAMLLGRRTFEMFESFWRPAYENDTGEKPHGRGAMPPEAQRAMRAFAKWINESTKYVVSSSLGTSDWMNTEILRDCSRATIEGIKTRPGAGIMLFGSGTIATQLTELGLIDEYQFILSPLLLGSGKPLFGALPNRTRLELLEATGHANGNVMLRYAPTH